MEEHNRGPVSVTPLTPRDGPAVWQIDVPLTQHIGITTRFAGREVLLAGRPTLRTPEGERELAKGDVACFPRGAAGTHQVWNDTEEPARIVMLSSSILPDIVEYPDSGKFYTLSAKGEMLFQTRYGEPVEYWDGES
jgi:hypothetical protein